ncbi:sugar ABC transporter ATP-binding protein [Rathayibacter sp. VKM Ac-2805]|uniref:ATP-binding cassette domain-containing protein n=1 Tax=Rathayibacter sp. VKM Ac-2805 TaxID=2609258 RepID=UPI001FCA3CD0|nr:sugar ABC transporter ATP-binding protein [Rathayibacter sp. VKM Ac-2805]
METSTAVRSAPEPTPRLELRDIGVQFGATAALEDVDLRVPAGQIVGLLGHNGAGKTTLFNVVSGVIAASSGSFSIDGRETGRRLTPRDASDLGITVIHQEPALAQNLSVLDNLFLGRPARPSADRAAAARAALDRVGSSVTLETPVGALGLGDRQLVDLARGLLAGDMKILLLDEPTAALGRAETDYLHALIRSLAAEGVTVMYVSHRLPDILTVCDRIVVLRGGRIVEDDDASSFTPSLLASALVPDILQHVFSDAHVGERMLETTQGPTITAHAGEVVGLFGMAAGEQFALLSALGGQDGRYAALLGGAPTVVTSPADAITKGVFLVPADRELDGLVQGQTALESVMLPWYSQPWWRGFWVSRSTGLDAYRRAREDFGITGPDHTAAVSSFSGGNRQKHLLARWTHPRTPRLLLLAQPTQGVDVGAKVDIVRVVRETAARGVCVLVASAESDEIASMCDRSYVMVAGRVAELSRSDRFDEDLLGELLALAAPAA